MVTRHRRQQDFDHVQLLLPHLRHFSERTCAIPNVSQLLSEVVVRALAQLVQLRVQVREQFADKNELLLPDRAKSSTGGLVTGVGLAVHYVASFGGCEDRCHGVHSGVCGDGVTIRTRSLPRVVSLHRVVERHDVSHGRLEVADKALSLLVSLVPRRGASFSQRVPCDMPAVMLDAEWPVEEEELVSSAWLPWVVATVDHHLSNDSGLHQSLQALLATRIKQQTFPRGNNGEVEQIRAEIDWALQQDFRRQRRSVLHENEKLRMETAVRDCGQQ